MFLDLLSPGVPGLVPRGLVSGRVPLQLTTNVHKCALSPPPLQVNRGYRVPSSCAWNPVQHPS